MLNERPQSSENLGRFPNQIFVVDFDIVSAQSATRLSALVHDPFPINPCRHRGPLTIPRERADLGKFLPRQGYIAAVTDHMNDERVGDSLLDAGNIQQVFGSSFRPSFHTLLATHLLHNDAEKITTVLALRHDSWLNFRWLEARTCIKTSAVPGIEHPALVLRIAEGRKRGSSRVKIIDSMR
jgi:hypothetical protein